MKTFIKQNWYRLMIATSVFIFSVGFFINSISKTFANPTNLKSNGIKVNDYYFFVDNGYWYKLKDINDPFNGYNWTYGKIK